MELEFNLCCGFTSIQFCDVSVFGLFSFWVGFLGYLGRLSFGFAVFGFEFWVLLVSGFGFWVSAVSGVRFRVLGWVLIF